jgi:hypothetical protein
MDGSTPTFGAFELEVGDGPVTQSTLDDCSQIGLRLTVAISADQPQDSLGPENVFGRGERGSMGCPAAHRRGH